MTTKGSRDGIDREVNAVAGRLTEPIVVRSYQRVREGKRQLVRRHIRRPAGAQLKLGFEFFAAEPRD